MRHNLLTSQCHKSEKTAFGDIGEMNDRRLFLAELCDQDIK